jgi:hypothetical protein
MKLQAPRLPGSHSLSFSPDGNLLACLGVRLSVFETSNWQRLFVSKPFPNLWDLAFSRNGNMLAIKNTSGLVAVIHQTTGQLLSTFSGKGEESGSTVSFVRGDSQLVDGTWKGILRFRSPLGGDVFEQTMSPNKMVTDLTYNDDSKLLLVTYNPKVLSGELSSEHNSYLLLLDLSDTPAQPRRIELESTSEINTEIQCVRFSQDAKFFCLATWVRTLRKKGRASPAAQFQIRSTKNGELICKSDFYELSSPRSNLSWSSDGKHVVAPIKHAFILLDTNNLREVGRVPWHHGTAVAFHPKNDAVVLGSSSKSKMISLDRFSDLRQ